MEVITLSCVKLGGLLKDFGNKGRFVIGQRGRFFLDLE